MVNSPAWTYYESVETIDPVVYRRCRGLSQRFDDKTGHWVRLGRDENARLFYQIYLSGGVSILSDDAVAQLALSPRPR